METVSNNLVENNFFNIIENSKTPKFSLQLDEKIANVAMPVLVENDALEECNTISTPLENRIDANVFAPKPLIDRINEELERMDAVLQDPFCPPELKVQQSLRVLELLQRLQAKWEKLYALGKDPEIWEDVQKLKGSYQTWSLLATSLISGISTVAGGFTIMASVVPGTAAGKSLANALPKAFQFFADANNAKSLASVGEGIKGVGQGSDVFQKLFSNGDQAKQVVLNYLIEDAKRKRSECQDAARHARDQGDGASNTRRTTAQTAHTAFEAMVKGTS